MPVSDSAKHNLMRIGASQHPVPLPTVNALVNQTGATAHDTNVVNLADGTTYANDHAALEANLATLAAKINQIIAQLKAMGMAV